MERRERANLEIDVTNFLKDQRYRVHPRTQDSHEEAAETGDQSNQENPSDVEFEYVTCHENFKNKKNNDTETPKLVNYSDDHEYDQGPSPLYVEQEEVIYETVADWSIEIKKESEQEDVQETPPRRVVLEETEGNTPGSGQEDVHRTPPRRVVFEETIRSTPVKQRVGPTKSEIREAQRTKSAKERLGKRRLNTGQGSVDRTKETKTEAIMRIVKKSRKERDSASYRQRHPRQAKES